MISQITTGGGSMTMVQLRRWWRRIQNQKDEDESSESVYALAAAALRAGQSLEDATEHLKQLPPAESKRVQNLLSVAFSSGMAAAPLLDCLQAAATQTRQAEALTRAALAGPAAAAKLLVALPLLAAVAAEVVGLPTIKILLGSSLGLMLLTLGLAFLAWGWLWTRKLVQNTHRKCAQPQLLELELVAQVTTALMRAGLSVPQCLRLVGRSRLHQRAAQFANLASTLEAGNLPPPQKAGGTLESKIWEAMRGNWEGGYSAQPQLALLVQVAQRQRRENIQTQTARLGVLLTLPLALCFLPAFISLAIMPAVLALLGSA